MELADVLEIERARNRRFEAEEKKTARFMAFLITLMTGKETKAEDLLKSPETHHPNQARRGAIFEAYQASLSGKPRRPGGNGQTSRRAGAM